MRVTALLATYNEERFIANCLEHLFGQDVDVYLIDNDSEDRTVQISRRYLNRGLLGIERHPREGVFRQRLLFARKEELSLTLPGDWFMHVDADEVHTPSCRGRTLAEAFAEVEAEGYNAVNFQEFTFTPTRESPDHDHANYLHSMRWYYAFTPFFPHRLNAWKRQPKRVNLAGSGGHIVKFPGLRMYPRVFCMRHYLWLSVDHAIRKYTGLKYAPEEVARGWCGDRATLQADKIALPRQAELLEYVSDDLLEHSNPRRTHLLLG
jgi:glycosyltransferase involved in cell wall biosynthesis